MFFEESQPVSLPLEYSPRRPAHFDVRRIILAKGALTTEERRRFVSRILALYPGVDVEDRPDVPHNRIAPHERGALSRLRLGKRALVLGVHGSAVRYSSEEGNTCPNYWHFSPYGFCPYGCAYCYLADTRTFLFSPVVKLFVNLPEIMAEIDRQANRLAAPRAFYLGKLQDALALDPLSGYSRVLVPFFAAHPVARMTLLTKCADVDNLLDLDHRGHTILSWSLNPPEIHERFEQNVPHPTERIQAMQRCAAAGYPVRAVLMPLVPVDGWRGLYARFLEELLTAVPLARLTMGGICSYPDAKRLMEESIGPDSAISNAMRSSANRAADRRARFSPKTRVSMYRALLEVVRSVRPELEVALCLEEETVFAKTGLMDSLGRCNCLL